MKSPKAISLALLIGLTYPQVQAQTPTEKHLTSRPDQQRLRRLETQFEQLRQLLRIPMRTLANTNYRTVAS